MLVCCTIHLQENKSEFLAYILVNKKLQVYYRTKYKQPNLANSVYNLEVGGPLLCGWQFKSFERKDRHIWIHHNEKPSHGEWHYKQSINNRFEKMFDRDDKGDSHLLHTRSSYGWMIKSWQKHPSRKMGEKHEGGVQVQIRKASRCRERASKLPVVMKLQI